MPTTPAGAELDRLAINTLKMLAVDAVEQAKSGHPGLPMGAADLAYLLFTRHLRFDPQAPDWIDRDRFVLSAGHGSMLLYGLLHLCGYDLTLDDLRHFRQWESRTPGHPEHNCAPGVETTTGPLGQGVGNAVGMAIAARRLAERFNTRDHQLINHRVWALVSDGDMMEGVASEAASIAGHLSLGNLTFIYDDNRITIEGETSLAFSEDVGRRFEAYGFEVERIDGHDHAAILAAFDRSARRTDKPGLIVARTHIANGSPGKHDTADAHGSPLGPEETRATKQALGWPLEPTFLVPDEARRPYRDRAAAGAQLRAEWTKRFDAWSKAEPQKRADWDQVVGRTVPANLLDELLAAVPQPAKPEATRSLSGKILQKAAALVPALAGGSADLEPSTKTAIKGSPSVNHGAFAGRNFHFGIREHGMGSVLNGMALGGGTIPYGATFLIFSDYMRPPMRLAALMGLQVIYVFTHDSLFLGEDGPTHQPIEQLPSLRAVPNLLVVRPADGVETAAAWAIALERRDGPTALVMSRQDLPPLARAAAFDKTVLMRGGYLLNEVAAATGKKTVTLIATGSEVSSALEAQAILKEKGIGVRVVSMPCPQTFLHQPADYRAAVVPPGGRNVVIEAAVTQGWERIAGTEALLIGVTTFGASAPWKTLQDKYGLSGARVAEAVLEHLA